MLHNSYLPCSLLPFFSFCFSLIHSSELWMSQCGSWIQRVRRSGALTVCGGGRVETTEQRWSLKVRYERDVAEQALSLCYTAGSVTTDCSPTFLPLFLYVPSLLSLTPSQILLCFFRPHLFFFVSTFTFSPCHFPLALSVFISFFIPLYCLSLSGLLSSKSLLLLPDSTTSNHRKHWSWNIKLGSMMHYKTP